MGLTAQSMGAPPTFKITGNITGGREGMKIYLKYADLAFAERTNIDSAVLHNGQFEFSGSAAAPRFVEILFRDLKKNPEYSYEDRMINLFVENAAISVKAVYDSLPMEFEGWYGIKPGTITVTGSKSEDFYQQYEKEESALVHQKTELFEEYIKVINSKEDSMATRYKKGIPVSRRMDEADSLSNRYNMTFIKSHAPDDVNAYIALQVIRYGRTTTEQVDSLIQYFDQVKEKGFLVKRFLEKAPSYRRTAIGSTAIDMTLSDSSGKTYTLSNYIGKGKYVMLEFWASWCGPCRADIPHLKAAYQAYHPEGFEIISVSLDDKKDKWLKAMDQEKMPWMQLADMKAFDGELPTAYHINGIPYCLLFDPQGRLVTENMRGSWMDRRLIELYGDHFPG